jgi:hypothetical protein
MNLNRELQPIGMPEALTEADGVARPCTSRCSGRACPGRDNVPRSKGRGQHFAAGQLQASSDRLVHRIARARSSSTRRSASPRPLRVEKCQI